MKKILFTLAFSSVLVSTHAQHATLEPLAGFGLWGDGSLRPGDGYDFVTDTGRNQRGMVYNPATGHLIIANRNIAPSMNIVDGDTAGNIGTMDLSALTTGGDPAYPINVVGIADDGAIYVGNETFTNSPPEYRLYRWNDETATQQLFSPAIRAMALTRPTPISFVGVTRWRYAASA